MENQENKKISTPALPQKRGRYSAAEKEMSRMEVERMVREKEAGERRRRELENELQVLRQVELEHWATKLKEKHTKVAGWDGQTTEWRVNWLKDNKNESKKIKRRWYNAHNQDRLKQKEEAQERKQVELKHWATKLKGKDTKVAGWDGQTIEWREDWLKNNPDKSKKVKNRWYTAHNQDVLKQKEGAQERKQVELKHWATKLKGKDTKVAGWDGQTIEWREDWLKNNKKESTKIKNRWRSARNADVFKQKKEEEMLFTMSDIFRLEEVPKKCTQIRGESPERVISTFAPLAPAFPDDGLLDMNDELFDAGDFFPTSAEISPDTFATRELKKRSQDEKMGMFK